MIDKVTKQIAEYKPPSSLRSSAARGLQIDGESFRECNLQVNGYRFLPSLKEESEWVRLELDLSAVDSRKMIDKVVISLSYIV